MKRKASGYPTPPNTPKKARLQPRRLFNQNPRMMSRGSRYAANAMGYAGEAYNAGKYLATGNYLGAAMDYGPRIVKSLFGSKASAARRSYKTKGQSAGRFKKGRKNRTNVSIYANKGILLTSEVGGTVTDPDCVYIAHTACDVEKVITESIDALFRKLFEKAGFMVTNLDDRVAHVGITDAKDWTVQLTEVAGQTGVESVNTQYVTVAASTVKTIATQFYGAFKSFSAGQTYTGSGAAATDTRLYRLILYTQDYNVTLAPTFHCSLNLKDEMLHMYGCSEIKIQNRTLSADGGTDEDNVSSNPLIGRNYLFSSMPRTRDKSAFPLNAIPVNQGVQLTRAGQLTNNQAWKEPPDPVMFTNCRKSAKIRLEPGDIKWSKLVSKKRMNFLDFLERIRLQSGITPAFNVYNSIFPSEIFAFEDIINVNGSQNISCAYEINQTIGVWFRTSKKATGVQSYTTATFSNNTP